ncbi:6-phospho-alpha-glucosidase [Psychrobacillus psychrotolerans]|uniref:family 4 glycosyl hydrolase n=1 Tax=Psychrobacillus psychrotolerans TaxID=126156 RepID=UPI003315CF8A
MEKQHLTIAGGGSTYTLGMLMSLISEKDNFPLASITFYDTDIERQQKVADASKVVIKEKYPELEEFVVTSDKETAYKDKDFIFVQIRTGGLEMRIKDEEIPLSHGIVGQETCGPGGMAYGLRSIKDMIELVEDIRFYSKDAWILNYTNPAAIVAEALKRVFPEDHRLINICDMPISIMNGLSTLINRSVWDLDPEYFGLNHFGWFTDIYDTEGHNLTDEIKNKILSEGLQPESEIAEDPSWIATFKQVEQTLRDFPEYIPNTYLQYYLYPKKMVEKENPKYTRASQVISGRAKEVFEMCERIVARQTLADEKLEGDVHGVYMVKIAESFAYNKNEKFIVMTKNNGTIPNIPNEAIIEVPALITSNGVKPIQVGEIGIFYKGLMESQYAYEKLTVDAYFEGSRLKLLQALTLNRTVVNANVANDILTDLLEANKDYWPNFA